MSDIMHKILEITENISITEVVMKKIYSVIFILLAFIITFGCFSGFTTSKSYADEISKKQINTITAKSKSAYLIDFDTNTVIYSKNELEKMPIASMCKIMTLLLCFEAIENNELSLDDVVIVSENASGMGGSHVFLEANGEYQVGDLIKSIVVASANDACVAMAEKLCGNQQVFVNKMNEKTKELGMDNTVFVNCTGLPCAGQFSCAKDVSIMFSELLKHDNYYMFSKIWTDVVIHPNNRKTEISNTNKLIRFYQGCDAGKTGYTNEAGHCLAASACRNGMRLISIVISAQNSKERFADVSNMFNFGFGNFVNKKIIDKNKPLDLDIQVKGGKKDKLEVVCERSVYLFSEKTKKRSVEFSFEPKENLFAPIKIGELVGVLHVFENGVEINSVNVLANENILAKNYFDIIGDISNNWSIV